MNGNSVTLVGNVTRDPELRFVCWREMAENASESLTKGSRVLVTGRLEQRSWETPEGERRSKIEVVADEIGPSLRWATAEVRKNDRRGPGDGGGQATNGARPAPVASAPPPPTYDYGEEPF
jgi:single-strand DNA-binding protein